MNVSGTVTGALPPAVLADTWVPVLTSLEGGVRSRCPALVAALASLCLYPSRGDDSPGSSRGTLPRRGSGLQAAAVTGSAGTRLAGHVSFLSIGVSGACLLLLSSLGGSGFPSVLCGPPEPQQKPFACLSSSFY